MKAVTIRMDDELHKEIKDMAWMKRVSINSYILQAIENQIKIEDDQDVENKLNINEMDIKYFT